MSQSPIRYKKLLAVLPKNNYDMQKSAIEAGFTKNTASKQSKRLLASAIKSEAREILEAKSITPIEAKKFMSDIIGLSSSELFERLKYIATQSKDLSSALKVLVPLAVDYGVQLQSDDAEKTIVPTLNVTMISKTQEKSHEVLTLNTTIVDDNESKVDDGGTGMDR